MPRKEWTDEERKAFGAKMKAKREAKKSEQVAEQPVMERIAEEIANPPELTEPPKDVEPAETTISVQDYQELMAQIKELQAANWRASQTQPQGDNSRMTTNGQLGVMTKYKLEGYPDPTERLAHEPRLARFAFEDNYQLVFTVNSSEYTHNGIRTQEPKFELELDGFIFDEESGEPTGRAYVCRRLIMHEDPETALVIARREGIEVGSNEEPDFLDEMRYIRMRDWLIDYFYPKPIIPDRQNKVDMVVGGKMFETFEVNSASATGIPFSQSNGSKF